MSKSKLKEYIRSLLFEEMMNEFDMAKTVAKNYGWSLKLGKKTNDEIEIIFKNKDGTLITTTWNQKQQKFVGKMFVQYKKYKNNLDVSMNQLIMFLKS